MRNFYPPGFKSSRPCLAIDFDGVIHDANLGWGDGTCYGKPIEGAIESISLLSGTFDIVVFTAKARSDRPLVDGKTGTELVWEWLTRHGLRQHVRDVTADKPRAELYIDDNGYRFERWDETVKFIHSL